MTSALFTYYTSDLEDIFLDNVNSLIKNSTQQYDTIIICSLVTLPQPILKSLYRTHRVVRVHPDGPSKLRLSQAESGSRLMIHPFFSTAISYRGADIVTVFDSNLFVIGPVPAYSNHNIFYKNHTGEISTALFTVGRNSEMTNMLVTAFETADFRDQTAINRLAFLVGNALALRPYQVISEKHVFSKPNESDQIRIDRLIALDFTNLKKTSPIYKQMLAIRQESLPKVTTLTRIKRKTSQAAQTIDRAISRIGSTMSLDASSNYRILFKYTSRSRPDLFYRGLSSIVNNCDSSNFIVLCSLDSDDPTLPRYKDLISQFSSKNIKVVYGHSKNKVDAINRDLNAHSGRWDILVNMSDDMIFTEYGFDMEIRYAFGNELDQFIHFNDGIQFSNLCSMTIEGRPYYRRFNYIYNPEYTSLWCDFEAQEVAKNLSRYRYMGDDLNIIRHLHPTAGLAEFDEQYKKTEARELWDGDRRVYQMRKASGFKDTSPIEIKRIKPKFSILILTLHSRISMFDTLLEELTSQINKYDGKCEILWELDNGERTTGEKRNSLLDRASGEYVAFFDDDDWPSPNYVSSIMTAIKSKPDCCSLLGEMTTNGMNPEIFEHSLRYNEWRTNSGSPVKYERNPNHINTVKASIAKTIKFPAINHGEDRSWSDKLAASGLLKTEATIPNVIYYYQYIQQK